jgi:hypothetical protein
MMQGERVLLLLLLLLLLPTPTLTNAVTFTQFAPSNRDLRTCKFKRIITKTWF